MTSTANQLCLCSYCNPVLLAVACHSCSATVTRCSPGGVSLLAVLNQCNYVVLDEADRMIDLGFEPQVRSA